MVFEFYNGSSWELVDGLSENLFFGDLDGYDGSEKTVFFRVRNETGDPVKNNMMLRVVERYNLSEYPLLPEDGTNKVKTTDGNPIIEGKVKYSLKRDANETIPGSGIAVTPDSQGLFRIGDLIAENGTLTYSVTVTTSPRIIVDFGATLKISEIFFRYFSTSI